tara:strand:+ start:7745 stop:8320 length:576 start_codon:yes stop_codon:yes gene_type:complete
MTTQEELKLNKLYIRDLGDMSHCEMSHQEMIEHYNKNSSPLSFLLEKKLAKWYNNIIYDSTPFKLEYITSSGVKEIITIKPDLRDKETKKILFDQKAFNNKGGNFVRSCMKGAKRKKDKTLWIKWCKSQIFIWTDLCNLPIIRVIAISGVDCLKLFPNGNIRFKDKDILFNNNNLLPISVNSYKNSLTNIL